LRLLRADCRRLQTPFDERDVRLSPDGEWPTFTSNESGTGEAYVTTFPTAGRRHRASTDGGGQARWGAGGKEIVFQSRNRLMSATFSVTPAGDPALGTPRVLFTLPEDAGRWTVADNGQRFLVNLQVTPGSRGR
jgi:hypothetical protein